MFAPYLGNCLTFTEVPPPQILQGRFLKHGEITYFFQKIFTFFKKTWKTKMLKSSKQIFPM